MSERPTIIADAFRTRTARGVLLAVFVTVIIVQAAFLFNATRNERNTALHELAENARLSVVSMFLTHPYPMTDKLLLATSELLLPGTPISGGTYLREDGSVVGSFGVAPAIHNGLPKSGGGISDDGRFLEAVWPKLETGAPYGLAVKLDISGANLKTDAYTSRNLTAGLILSIVIGGAIALSMTSLVLLPLAKLRRALGLAPGRTDTIEAEWDEVLDAATRRERSPRLENPDVERRVEERTTELRAEIEKRAETEVKLSRLAQMANDAIGPMLRIDGDGKVLYANEQARKLLTAWGTVPGGVLPGRWRDRLTSFVQRGRPGDIEELIDGRWMLLSIVPYADQGVVNVYGFDVTDRPQGSLNPDRNSQTGGSKGFAGAGSPAIGLAVLTGRPALEERLAQGLAHAATHNGCGVLYYVEIEEFADIAKSVGHDAAVRFLGEIGARLRSTVGPAPAILRLERCLFAIVEDGMLGKTPDTQTAAHQAEALTAALTEPFRIDDHTIKTNVGIGITSFPSDGENVQQLIRNAGMALDHAKGEAPTAFRFFMAATNELVDLRASRLAALKRAVNSGSLALQFQPCLDIKSCRIRSAEALVRWPEPGAPGGLSLPGAFLPIARDGGLMESIGKWVLYSACKANKAWQQSDLPFIRVAVNVPAELVAVGDLASTVNDVLRRTELDAAYLEIDVSEETAAAHRMATARAFEDLRDLGVATSVDGFSGEQLSLRDLCTINPQRLKLRPDQVTAIGADPTAGQTVRAAIMLAGGIDAAVTAIGAETPEQIDFLHSLNVGELQGHAFSAPLPETAFKSFIDNFSEATLALPEAMEASGLAGGLADRTRRLI
ncbi:MAG: EAL domain-containing protein [Rhodospirillales bacterium]